MRIFYFILSSKGRRNYLKLHRHVGWDMERAKEDPEPSKHSPGELEKKNRNHCRLLPILMHEEVLHLDQSNQQTSEVSTKVDCEMLIFAEKESHSRDQRNTTETKQPGCLLL